MQIAEIRKVPYGEHTGYLYEDMSAVVLGDRIRIAGVKRIRCTTRREDGSMRSGVYYPPHAQLIGTVTRTTRSGAPDAVVLETPEGHEVPLHQIELRRAFG